jgi:hypothetical protein
MPNNAGYYHAAYIAAVILYGGYAFSIWWRARGVRARLRGRERT